MDIPSKEEFRKGVKAYKKNEPRDAMYKVATFLVSHFWGKPSDMADALGVLLLTWNQAFYRYGSFDFDKLEKCISDNIQKLSYFRKRDIFTLSSVDEADMKNLFYQFLEALQINDGKRKGEKSPVSVSKALHLLAPNFFPLWDREISRKYKCNYNANPAEKYFEFCNITKTIAEKVRNYIIKKDKPLTKLIDEYNYAKFSKKWI